MIVSFDAGYFARGWLAVALASRPDKDLPMLDRTVHLELYPDGCRLVATDRTMLLHAWVPAVGKEGDPPPGLDDAPLERVTAYDTHRRAAGLFTHLLSLLSVDDPPDIEVTVSAGDEVRDAAASGLLTFAGLERRQVSFMATGRELLLLDLFEGDWPDWRAVTLRHVPKRTSAVALNCDAIGRLAGLGKLYEAPLEWRFGGVDWAPIGKMAAVAIGSDPRVEGVVMPDRFEFGDPD